MNMYVFKCVWILGVLSLSNCSIKQNNCIDDEIIKELGYMLNQCEIKRIADLIVYDSLQQKLADELPLELFESHSTKTKWVYVFESKSIIYNTDSSGEFNSWMLTLDKMNCDLSIEHMLIK